MSTNSMSGWGYSPGGGWTDPDGGTYKKNLEGGWDYCPPNSTTPTATYPNTQVPNPHYNPEYDDPSNTPTVDGPAI